MKHREGMNDLLNAMVCHAMARNENAITDAMLGGGAFKVNWEDDGLAVTPIALTDIYKPIPSPSEAAESS